MYKEDLEIDKFALDKEWEKQASLYCEWGEKEVEAQFNKDKLKEQLDLTRAEVDGEIRKSAARSNIKITEAAISAEILKSRDYQKANNDYLEAIRDAKIFGIAKEAFEHKKKALEKLTDLFLAGYWAEPKQVTKDNHTKMLERRLIKKNI
jgi:hypothetical protein